MLQVADLILSKNTNEKEVLFGIIENFSAHPGFLDFRAFCPPADRRTTRCHRRTTRRTAPMIDDHDQGFLFLFKAFGSVIPRAFIWGVIGAVEGYLLDASKFKLFLHRNGPLGGQKLELWHHPYSVHVLGTVLGFALVMRVQIAYARFWEGATQLRSTLLTKALRAPLAESAAHRSTLAR